MIIKGHATRRIINEVRGINRVVYDITSKLPGAHRVGVGEPFLPAKAGMPRQK